jgi:CRISPR/Cas system-associated endonuclease Cas3-HD
MNNEEIRNQEETLEQEETVERSYELRRLKDRDLFPILGIVSAVFPDNLAEIFRKAVAKGGDKEKVVEEIGVDAVVKIVQAVMKNMDKVQDDVYSLLSSVSGIPAEEIQDMPFGTTPMMIYDIIISEKNNGFFKVLSKLF